ncbi:Btb/poz domain-containing protein [Pandoravirus kuranda]|uniref:Btb/poz domain-containing protein n=1 Tax=Pandoravirus kuranda TaxID=3019033 RepID=A0AA95EE55_9VIRU|nr:Btb/poz domain-containing protein [Pandoravirus kuranda]
MISDSSDDEGDDYRCMSHLPSASLGSVRRVHCDCVIQASAKGASPDSAVEAHRAVLARAAYFARLFEHTDPDCVQERDDEGRRIFRLVYAVTLPFSSESLAFLVKCLYMPSCVDQIETCSDPVDVVQASLFLGMPAAYTDALIDSAFAQLLAQVKKDPCADAIGQLGAFVLHVLASDIEPPVKKTILERILGTLNEADRDTISTNHADLMPVAHYEPVSAVGAIVPGENGRRWRRLRIAVDNIDPKGGVSTVTWQGLVFGAKFRFTNYDREPLLGVVVSCAPQGETLGAWPWGAESPDGVVDAEARPVRLRVIAYHPTYGSSTKLPLHALTSMYKSRSGRDDPRVAHEASLPKGTHLAPFALVRSSHTKTAAQRKTLEAFMTKYEHGGPTARSLVACEVIIDVQEIDS